MATKPSKWVLGGREKVQVAIVQKSPAFMNRDASVARACAAIEEAGRHGAQLVVFPEAWLAGYPYWTDGVGLAATAVGGRADPVPGQRTCRAERRQRAHRARRPARRGIRRARLQRDGPQAGSPDDLQQPDIFCARRHGARPTPQTDADLHRAPVLGAGRRA